MIGHKLPNKTKSATVAEPKLFHQAQKLHLTDQKGKKKKEKRSRQHGWGLSAQQ
jgi:hypothetical protein